MNTAIFPGKYQPLHLGHILSICRIKEMGYQEIYIILTHDTPHITTPEENEAIIKKIFEYDFKSGRMKSMIISKTLLDHDSLKLPNSRNTYDILTGNKSVLKWSKNHGYNPVFFPRTEGVGYSGSEIRKLYNL
jgi:nicotinamide mononucleotide adenylyltransferase